MNWKKMRWKRSDDVELPDCDYRELKFDPPIVKGPDDELVLKQDGTAWLNGEQVNVRPPGARRGPLHHLRKLLRLLTVAVRWRR